MSHKRLIKQPPKRLTCSRLLPSTVLAPLGLSLETLKIYPEASPDQTGSEKTIEAMIFTLKNLQGVAGFAIKAVPLLKPAISAALGVLETIKTTTQNRKYCQPLAEEIYTNIRNIFSLVFDDAFKEASTVVHDRLDDFVKVLQSIRTDILLLSRRNFVQSLLWNAVETETLQSCQTRLQNAQTTLITFLTAHVTLKQGAISREQEAAAQRQEIMARNQIAQYDRQRLSDMGRRLHEAKALFDPDKGCLAGTRVELLEEIRMWAREGSDALYWLRGVAGFGKSAIAHHLASEWNDNGVLAASFFFSLESEFGNPSRVCSSLAEQLALIQPLRAAILSAMDHSSFPSSFRLQFTSLISKPILEQPLEGWGSPKIIVLDALDECADRTNLIQTLVSEIPKLRCHVRFFVTSRQEPDLTRALADLAPTETSLTQIDGEANLGDIRTFVRVSLQPILNNPEKGFTSEDVDALAARADGLFIWAKTACLLLLDWNNPKDVLADLLVASPGAIDQLYEKALGRTIKRYQAPSQVKLIRQVLVVIATARQPLTIATIDQWLKLGKGGALAAVEALRSVVSISGDGTVKFLHPTFHEFLSKPHICPPLYLINITSSHEEFALRCFEIMPQYLRHDICHIKNPALLNKEVPDLELLKSQNLPEILRYACHHWARHIMECDAKATATHLTLLLEFFASHLLEWIEVLSLTASLDVGLDSLLNLRIWLEKFPTEKTNETAQQASDAIRFLQSHFSVIHQSAFQIYLSALGFTPLESWIYRTYSSRHPSCKFVIYGNENVWGACIATMEGHTGPVVSVAFSPDGRTVASGSDDTTVRLWSTELGAPLHLLEGHNGTVQAVTFSRDSTMIASGSHDHSIRLWAVSSGSLLRVLDLPGAGNWDWVLSVAFSADNSGVWAGYETGAVRLWSVRDGTLLKVLENVHDGLSVQSIVVSLDGLNVVTGGGDSTIRTFAPESRLPGLKLVGHGDWLRKVAISENGKVVMSGSGDDTVRFWDAQSGSLIRTFEGQGNPFGFSVNAKTFVSQSTDNAFELHSAEMGTTMQRFEGHTDRLLSLELSFNGKAVVSGSDDRSVRLWTVAPSGEYFNRVPNCDAPVTFSPNDGAIATSFGDRVVRLWSKELGFQPDTLEEGYAPICVVTFFPDGGTFALGCVDGTIQLSSAKSGLILNTLHGHAGSIRSIVFSHDYKTIASGSTDRTTRLWSVESGRSLQTMTCDVVHCVSFSPDDRIVAAGCIDTFIWLWSTQTGQYIRKLGLRSGAIRCIDFSQDGLFLASGSDDNTIRIWAVSGAGASRILAGHTKSVRSLGFSPDGELIVSCSDDNTLRLWKWGSATALHVIGNGTNQGFTSVAFMPDSRTLACASANHEVQVWCADSGVLLRTLTSNPNTTGARSADLVTRTSWVQRFNIPFNNKAIATIADDFSTIKLWGVEGDLVVVKATLATSWSTRAKGTEGVESGGESEGPAWYSINDAGWLCQHRSWVAPGHRLCFIPLRHRDNQSSVAQTVNHVVVGSKFSRRAVIIEKSFFEISRGYL